MPAVTPGRALDALPGIPARALSALLCKGLYTVGDLLAIKHEDDLREIRGIGECNYAGLMAAVHAAGYEMAWEGGERDA